MMYRFRIHLATLACMLCVAMTRVPITTESAGAKGLALLEKTNRLSFEKLDDSELQANTWGRWEI